MAKGEMTYSSSDRKVSKFESNPPAPGDYDFKLRTSKLGVSVADGVGKVPYLSGIMLELLNTKTSEGGKNRVIFHRLFLRLDPAKDGVASVDRGDGLTALLKATGLTLKGVTATKMQRATDDGQMVDCVVLDPQKVALFLKANDGAGGQVHTKVTTWQDKKRGEVDYFIEASGEEEEEEDEESEEQGEDEEAEDEEPAPAPVKKLGKKK